MNNQMFTGYLSGCFGILECRKWFNMLQWSNSNVFESLG